MLAYRLRRWPNIKPALVQCIVFAGETYRTAEQLLLSIRSHVKDPRRKVISNQADQADQGDPW